MAIDDSNWRKHPQLIYDRCLIRDKMIKKVAIDDSNWRKHPQLIYDRCLIRDKIRIIIRKLKMVIDDSNWRKHPQLIYDRCLIRDKIAALFNSTVDITNSLEYRLLINAPSKEEYVNLETLAERLRVQLYKLHTTLQRVPSSGSLLTHSNGRVPEPLPVAFPDVNGTNYSAVSKVEKSHPSLGSNTYFLQQHSNGVMMNLMKYRDCSATIEKNDSLVFHLGNSLQSQSSKPLIPQSISRETSQGPNFFRGSSSRSIPRNVKQYQPRKSDFQQNIQPSAELPIDYSSDCFGDEGGCSHQNLQQTTLKRPHFRLSLLNEEESSYSQPQARKPKLISIGAYLENNTSVDQETAKMVQPYSSRYSYYKSLPQLQLQPESPFSSIYSDNRGCIEDLSMDTRRNEPETINLEHMQSKIEFNQGGIGDAKKFIKRNDDEEKETKSLSMTVNIVPRCIEEQNMDTLCNDPVDKDVEDIQIEKNFDQEITTKFSSTTVNISLECVEEQNMDTLIDDSMTTDIKNIQSKTEINKDEISAAKEFIERKANQEKETKSSSTTINIVLECMEDLSMDTLSNDPMDVDTEDIQSKHEFNQDVVSAATEVIERKVVQEKETESPSATVNVVSLTEYFTRDQIEEHITSLRKQSVKSTTGEETGILANTCKLCTKEKVYFAPKPIYCSCCHNCIKPKENYYNMKAEEAVDTQHCFCSTCYKNSRCGNITFDGKYVSKQLLDRKKNVEGFEEGWVQCNKCDGWIHQVCALYNDKRDICNNAEYKCPICCSKEIEKGMHVPLPKTSMFGAKHLPTTMLSDHIEKRLLKRINEERADMEKVEGNENLDEVFAAEGLSVRVLLSLDKQLKVKKQFRDICSEDNYPAEFSYRSRVILLFQQIEGVDVCLFVMYVQEFGSECGYPNQRCVYISYLDSVKYFRPETKKKNREGLRTIVYHEILIGYLDFCKKRGFTTCYIWACPPSKGDDYVFYCHPDTQKTPTSDQLRKWYHSMLRKAAEENIVVGLSNLYDHFFVSTEKCGSKVTIARLPYFDGDYWSGAAMDLASKVEQESREDYEKILKKTVNKRTLKAMGHENPSKGTAKDILVMQKLGDTILCSKENFIIVHLQHTCMHCHEVIVSEKRWFCPKCKKFMECERCHTADSHTSISGKKHILHQVVEDDVLSDAKEENDIIIDNGLFENRHDFLSFCQKNNYQFDTLRRAKYSTMMILDHLKNPTLLCQLSGDQKLKQNSILGA